MTVPDLGFGTASIMGRVSQRKGIDALEQAYSAGIRHFDTARSYGWGATEKVLGSFLSHRPREDFRLVSKCGILPARASPFLTLAKKVGRTVLSLAPGLRKGVNAIGSKGLGPTYTYDVETLRASLRTSLDELDVSYLDTFLLHNFEPGKPGLEEVVAWFRALRQEGVIRRFGFSIEGSLTAGLSYLGQKDMLLDAVIQVPVSEDLLSLPQEWRSVPVIAHSAFGFLRRQAPEAVSTDALSELLHRLGDSCRCETLVCSMFTPAHLLSNVAAWKRARERGS